ncbi:hypothetical protein [Actinomarinicola tropica]|uniref:Uncharacterized protein n=1 Tax=Actinomarinicola tropica TaxID=2789776 RepID=A0A5Q2RG41_9ACTN|nr:hypothetical protein [Actinomarinicola tropica]QGG94673.1 hypothetical protein GH723_05865 [Actinomarinicola tropica]
MPHRLVTLILTLCVIAAACGDDGGDDPAADPADDTTTSTTEVEADGAEEPLPDNLADLVGPSPGLDPGAAQQWYLDREVERQEALVACMDEAGFEYVPVDPAELSESPWDADIPWESDEWVATYGFGASTLRYPSSVLGPDLVGYDDQPDDAEPHPNQVYVQGLPEDEQEAWSAARTDCDARAWQDSQSENLAAAFNERFADELAAMYDAVRDDPRYQQILEDVRACVRETGVEYVDHETTLNAIEERLAPLDPVIADGTLDEATRAELAAIQQEEIAVATAVADCDGRFLSDNPDYQALLAEHEAEFIAEHEDQLRDFLSQADA